MRNPVETPLQRPVSDPHHRRLNWPFIVIFTGFHAAAFCALAWHWSWSAVLLPFLGLVSLGWIGIGLCYHRLLAHGSFKVSAWLERILATIGALNIQGGPITWVATHIQHHAKPDKPGDPHSPKQKGTRKLGKGEGFWWSHVIWMARGGQAPYRFNAIERLKRSRYYRFLEVGQLLFQVPIGVGLYFWGGWSYVLFGIFVRVVLMWHVTSLINSACHLWGRRRFPTDDDSRNNWLVNLFAGGEGLHNNHHHSPRTAYTRVGRWDFDPTGWMIRGLSRLGLATEVFEKRTGA